MNKTIYSLALLKTNWESRRATYIDNFLALVLDRLKHLPSDTVSAPELRTLVAEEYGVLLPLRVIDKLLVRATKRKYLDLSHGAYHLVREKLREVDLASDRSAAHKSYLNLTDSLAQYATAEYNLDWTPEDADRALTTYLADAGHRLLRAVYNLAPIQASRHKAKTDRYVLATWVNTVLSGGYSNAFDDLKSVAEGNFLIGGLFMPRGTGPSQRFKDTTIYLDTKPLLEFMGYSGSSLKAPQEELVQLLKHAGARLGCFEHTLDEVQSVLRGAAHGLSTSSEFVGYGPVYRHFREADITESDALLLANMVPRNLESSGIHVDPKPEYNPSLQIDEESLEAAIGSAINYTNPHARRRDVDSVSAIVRLRGNAEQRELETSGAIFCTPNQPLTRSVLEWQQEADDALLTSVGLVILDRDLTNIAWLKQPVLAPDLPRRQLIADFYAAIQPDESFVKRYFVEVDKLKSAGTLTEDDVFLLKQSLEARQQAMDLTLGNETAFTQGTVAEVLEAVRENIQAKARKEVQSREEKIQDLERRHALLHDKALQAETRRHEISVHAARRISWILWFLIAGVLIAAAYLSTAPLDNVQGGSIYRLGATVVMTIVTIIGLVRDAFGARRWLELRITSAIRRVLRSLAGVV